MCVYECVREGAGREGREGRKGRAKALRLVSVMGRMVGEVRGLMSTRSGRRS